MDKFRIRWVDSMHTGDNFELILQALEVGRDEGPIILVPRRAARRLGTKAGADYQALVFEGRVRQCGVNSVVASGRHFQAALGVICSG